MNDRRDAGSPTCVTRPRRQMTCRLLSAVFATFVLTSVASAQDKPDTNKLLPVPFKSDREATLKTIQELYAEQYQDRTPKGQLQFAKSLLKVADEDSHPVAKFVLYSEAFRIAEALGDFPTAWQSIGKMSKQYKIDDLKIQINLLETIGKKNKDPEQAYRIALIVQPKIENLVSGDKFSAAIELTKALETVAKRSRNKTLSRELANSQKELKLLAKRLLGLAPAFTKLNNEPDNLAANSLIGQFYFFEKGDYQKGIPFLAKGKDKRLAAISGKELKAQSSTGKARTQGELVAADAWWDMADTVDDKQQQSRLREHAVALYSDLVTELTGIDKVRIQKRINSQFSLREDFFNIVWEIPWKTQDDWEGVQFREDGKIVYTIKPTQISKTVSWQPTEKGFLVRPSQKRYFIFKLDPQGNLIGEKYEPKELRESVMGIRANR